MPGVERGEGKEDIWTRNPSEVGGVVHRGGNKDIDRRGMRVKDKGLVYRNHLKFCFMVLQWEALIPTPI